jgi:uncharacterized protein YndB with AHSA1/START domain
MSTTLRVGREVLMLQRLPAVVPVMREFERKLKQSPEIVFDAYADVDHRAQWCCHSDEVVVFDSHDFQVGGTDHFVRRSPDHPKVAGTIRYEHIEDNERIVFTERVVDSHGRLHTISVVTWTFVPSGTGTLLAITDQTTSIVGSRPIEGRSYEYEIMLDRLTRYLSDTVE